MDHGDRNMGGGRQRRMGIRDSVVAAEAVDVVVEDVDKEDVDKVVEAAGGRGETGARSTPAGDSGNTVTKDTLYKFYVRRA